MMSKKMPVDGCGKFRLAIGEYAESMLRNLVNVLIYQHFILEYGTGKLAISALGIFPFHADGDVDGNSMNG